MACYRCYILDADDHIVQAHDIDCETDTEAMSAAEYLLIRDPYYRAAEVWRAARRVLQLDRSSSEPVRPARRAPPADRSLGSVL